jgi:hypothetical protein
MLGVVQELHHIEIAIAGFDQVGLGPAAHLPDQAAGNDGHERAL